MKRIFGTVSISWFLIVLLTLTIGFALTFITPRLTVRRDFECIRDGRIELIGNLSLKSYFGPPNFGESPDTDSKENVTILILDESRQVCREGEDVANQDAKSASVGEVQLVIDEPYNEYLGKRVVVDGELFHAITGHHHTEVLVDVETIRLANSK